ncbi:hypothetical protein Q8F55_006056 [Vanrija albida]|uniref:Uncharacterized protein n=1 Tax=Vanrija albida TaxID=181172 RepID=A0ABR3Q399_9TREE
MSSSDQERFEHADPNAHDLKDSKDQRSIANRVEAAIAAENEDTDTPEVKALKEDPTLPAKMNGNEPSRGAKIDAQIQAEEEAELERKGKA